jgi:hypothetical protein
MNHDGIMMQPERLQVAKRAQLCALDVRNFHQLATYCFLLGRLLVRVDHGAWTIKSQPVITTA